MTISSQASLDDWEEVREERAAIAEHDGGLSRDEADTYSRQWLIECLARQILLWRSDEGRAFVEDWLVRYGQRHGAEAERALRDECNRQREVMRG